MRLTSITALLASLLLSLAPLAHAQDQAQATGATTQEDADYVKGRILAEPNPGLSDEEFDKILSEHGGKRQRLGESRIYIIELPPNASEKAVAAKLVHNPHMKYAELDRIVSTMVPNDPYLGNQWHLGKINTASAWDFTIGTGITVAILDSGVEPTHPDLVSKLVPGYNTYNNNTDTTDVCGHGTAVAGTAAATGNNSAGVAGVALAAKIMPIRIAYKDSSGSCWGTFSAMAAGVTWAADHGARIANISYANVPTSSSIQSAANYLRSKGGLLFASAGNSGTDLAFTPTNTMVVVSATDSNDAKASWSSFGTYVTLSAPGAGIWTTSAGGGYGAHNGTSFSSPVAAGVAALMMAANPSLSATQIESLLYSTAVDLGTAGKDSYFGNGRVNAAAAVAAAKSATAPSDTQAPTASITSPAGGTKVSGLITVQVSATDNVGVTRVDFKVNGNLIASDTAAPYTFTWDSKTVADGTASLTATAFDAAGNQATSSAISVQVANTLPPSDTTAPVISVSRPLAGGTVSGTTPVSATASDNSGTAGITMRLYIDGTLKAQSSGGTLNYNWNTRKYASGLHTLQFTAQDAAGNSSTKSIQVSK